ncbi:MAG: DUF502 domain-containing protein [Planctomycetaceae bacterium]
MNDPIPRAPENPPADAKPKRKTTARHFLLRGLAISMPSVLTLVILIWVARAINDYFIYPVSTAVRYTIARVVDDSRPAKDVDVLEPAPPLEHVGKRYRVTPELRDNIERDPSAINEAARLAVIQNNLDQVFVPLGDRAVPYADYHEVAELLGPQPMPGRSIGIYMELVTTRYFKSLFNLILVALVLIIIGLYFIGRLVTVRLGGWIIGRVETDILGRLPVISNVYSSVKQVTDFFFSERTVSYNRVVAVEYPRRGIWHMAFVTSDSLIEMTAAAGEPLVSLLIPTSPMPLTGFTVSLPRREVIDLNITIDQAFQYCLSCGVLVPPHQRVTPEFLQQELARRLAGAASQMVQRPVLEVPGGNDAHRTSESRPDNQQR